MKYYSKNKREKEKKGAKQRGKKSVSFERNTRKN